jgi:hypothetical protein
MINMYRRLKISNRVKRLIIAGLVCLSIVSFASPQAFAREKELSLTASASSVYYNSSYYGADKAIDNNEYTFWVGNMNSSPWWIMFDTGSIQHIDRLYIKWYNYSYYIPTNYDIQVSSDAANWTNIFSNIQGQTTETRQINQDARYIRLYIYSVGSYFPLLKEFDAVVDLDIPTTIRFTGKLKDKNQNPLNGTYSIKFRLYDTETQGVALWQETQTVSISNGVLDVELGSVTPIGLAFDEQYWLGIEVGTDGEMTPRFKLTSVPYSFISRE